MHSWMEDPCGPSHYDSIVQIKQTLQHVHIMYRINKPPLVNPSPQSLQKLPKWKVVLVAYFRPNPTVRYQKPPQLIQAHTTHSFSNYFMKKWIN